jgi:hypothetical protein
MLFGKKSSFTAPMTAYSAVLGDISKRFGRPTDFSPKNLKESFVMSKNQLVLACALKATEVESN